MEKVYTAQVNAHGNVIVCGDEIPRNSYRILDTGTYNYCLKYKQFFNPTTSQLPKIKNGN